LICGNKIIKREIKIMCIDVNSVLLKNIFKNVHKMEKIKMSKTMLFYNEITMGISKLKKKCF
jgi:hypothetical protein